MKVRTHVIRIGLALALALGCSPIARPSQAGDHSHEKSTQATPHTVKQAGYPFCISRIAHPSYNSHYDGGYVGGGQAFGGHDRCAQDGTWGWDYTGPIGRNPRIFLGWSHGRRAQGGPGQYATDGPHPLRHLTESLHEHGGEKTP